MTTTLDPDTIGQFSTRDVPWLKLGTQIDEPVSAQEALQLAELDFDVEFRNAAFATGKGGYRRVHKRVAVVRTDTDEFFDFVSADDYKIVQFRDAFGFLDELSGGRIVSAGPLYNGSGAFMVVQLTDVEGLGDLAPGGELDPHDLYVVVRTSHDRKKAVEVAALPLRGKCMNMLALSSMTVGAKHRWAIRHVGRPQDKIDEAAATLANVREYARAYADRARTLADIPVERETVGIALKRILRDTPRRDDTVNTILGNLHDHPTVGFEGTAWGAVNALSEYKQWGRNTGTRTPQSLFLAGVDGETHKDVDALARTLLTLAH